MTYRETVLCISTASSIHHSRRDVRRARGARRRAHAWAQAARHRAGLRRGATRAQCAPHDPAPRPLPRRGCARSLAVAVAAALLARLRLALPSTCGPRRPTRPNSPTGPATASTTSSTPCSSAPPTSPTRSTSAPATTSWRWAWASTVFWPALLAMRPDGLEAADLARLKGRYEALRTASAYKRLPATDAELSRRRAAAALPVARGRPAGLRGPHGAAAPAQPAGCCA